MHGDNSVEGRRGDQAGSGPQNRAKRTDPHSYPCAQWEHGQEVSGATARSGSINQKPSP